MCSFSIYIKLEERHNAKIQPTKKTKKKKNTDFTFLHFRGQLDYSMAIKHFRQILDRHSVNSIIF